MITFYKQLTNIDLLLLSEKKKEEKVKRLFKPQWDGNPFPDINHFHTKR